MLRFKFKDDSARVEGGAGGGASINFIALPI